MFYARDESKAIIRSDANRGTCKELNEKMIMDEAEAKVLFR